MLLNVALAAGLAVPILAATGESAGAQGFFGLFGAPSYEPPRAPLIRRAKKPRVRHIEPASQVTSELPPGPLHIIVSIENQSVLLYANGTFVARSVVSTGVPGHSTPTGVFSVLEKARWHESNIYSGAPMPYMQRITWSGVALHEGVVPGRPASHGCIRLRHEFAVRLFGLTRRGARVIIARSEIAPAEIAHPHLFVPKPKADETPVAAAAMIKTAEMTEPVTATDGIEVADAAVNIHSSEESEAALSAALRILHAIMGATDTAARKVAEAATLAEATGARAGRKVAEARVKETLKKRGPISVFISRKERKLYVRQGFEKVFDSPVTIREPAEPIGTHVYTAMELKDEDAALRWTVVTMPGEKVETHGKPKKAKRGREAEAAAPEARVAPEALAALDRIAIPPAALERISAYVSPGTSLIISDQGLGPETGLGTEFIVLTR